MRRFIGMALVSGLAVSAVACSDTSGVNETAPVSVSLQIDGSALASAGLDGTALLSAGGIDPSEVVSLQVEVTGLSFLSCDAECTSDGENDTSDENGDSEENGDTDDCCGEWTDLPLGAPVLIDLMALPTETDAAFVIVSGDLPIGEYEKIRISVGDAWIWFSTDQSKGQWSFPPNPDPTVDEGYDVTVPSGRLNTNVGLTVDDDGTGTPVEVNLVFDPNMTFQNVHTTGSGKVILTPQFRLR